MKEMLMPYEFFYSRVFTTLFKMAVGHFRQNSYRHENIRVIRPYPPIMHTGKLRSYSKHLYKGSWVYMGWHKSYKIVAKL